MLDLSIVSADGKSFETTRHTGGSPPRAIGFVDEGAHRRDAFLP
jgi:hypothetical protein